MKLSSAETELKLALPSGEAESVLRTPVLTRNRAGKAKSQRIVTTYYETPENDLSRRGLTLRLRQADGERIQTVKWDGEGGVAASRGEWEWRVTRNTPDLGLIKEASIVRLLADVPEDRLMPAVVTDVLRTSQNLTLDGDRVEASLDIGAVAVGETRQEIRELEFELREGTPATLYRLALELNSAVPFDIEVESKAARGFRLKRGLPPQPIKPAKITLESGNSAAEAFRSIVEDVLGHLLANQPAAIAGDAEGVHQARIAIRRLRSALRLFSPHLEAHAKRLFDAELRHAGRAIGEARDWDVFCDRIVPQVTAAAERRRFGQTIEAPAEARRSAAHETTARLLRDRSFRALALGLAAWAEEGREDRKQLGDKDLKLDIKDIAGDLLDRLDSKAAKRGRAVRPGASSAELHPLRKSLKKLRYSIEFLTSIYPPKKTKQFLRRLKKLQDVLGEINDAAMSARLAEGLAADNGLQLAPAVAAVSSAQARAARDAMKGLAKNWHAYCAEPRFWARA